jgi:hypothetical protein
MTVILELGNKNNEGVKQFFYSARAKHGYEKELRAIGECAKEDCVAIQLADFLAFYSWHYAVQSYKLGHVPEHMPTFLRLAKNKVKTAGRLGLSFSVTPSPSKGTSGGREQPS